MLKTGEWNELKIDRIKSVGAFLTDGASDVLLPLKQVPKGAKRGDMINVFVYKDSEDRDIATVNKPLITVGELARLKVNSVADFGAFCDWGLEKDIFLPFKEQTARVEKGREYLFGMYIDKSGRPCVTMRIGQMLQKDASFEKGELVDGTVYEYKKGTGAFVAVNDRYPGLVHESEIFKRVNVGERVKCRVIKMREDGKIDLAMRNEIPYQIDEDSEMIFRRLEQSGGSFPFTDKADKELIKENFGISKNAFKRAIGHLLKDGRIEMDEEGIRVKT